MSGRDAPDRSDGDFKRPPRIKVSPGEFARFQMSDDPMDYIEVFQTHPGGVVCVRCGTGALAIAPQVSNVVTVMVIHP